MRFKLCSLLLALAALRAHADAQASNDTPAADPARPTVTNPAHIPPPGYLQFEQGGFIAIGAPAFSSQTSVLETAKISLTHHLMVQEEWSPISHTSASTGSQNDGGSVILGAQALITDYEGHGHKPTIALGYAQPVLVGTAPDFDGGSFDKSLTLLTSGDAPLGIHYDTNIIVNQQTSGDVRRAQFGQAFCLTRSLTSKLSLTGEFWTFTQPFAHTRAAGNNWATGYTVKPNLVLDAGFNRGLTETSTHWYAYFGFTYLLPHALLHRSK